MAFQLDLFAQELKIIALLSRQAQIDHGDLREHYSNREMNSECTY